MLRKLLITAIEHHIIAGVGNDTGLEVVRNQEPGYTVEVIVGVDMAQQPVFCLHIVTGFRIDVAAARQDGYKQICGALFACYGVEYGNRITCPIHLHGVTRLVLDAHGGLGDPRPSAVLLSELSGLVRRPATLMALLAVLLPQQGHGHTALRQLLVNVGVIGLYVHRDSLVLVREEQEFKLLVRYIRVDGPADLLLMCSVQYGLDGVVRTAYNGRDLVLAVVQMLQP